MKSQIIGSRAYSALIAFFFILLFCSLGVGSSVSFAYDVATDTPVSQTTETSTLETQAPVVDNGGFTETITAILATQQPTETETASPIPTEIVQALEGEYVPNEILVRFKPTTRESVINNCFAINPEGKVDAKIDAIGVYILKVPNGQAAHALGRIINCAGVLYAEPNYIAHITDTIPNDPYLGNQYGLNTIRAPLGWDLSTGSPAVMIAIVDSGVDLSHPDLAGKIVFGYDFVNNDSIPQDDNGHGTHVAGIAAAVGNNGVGVAGVSWGALILPIKVLNALGNGSFADVAAGIIWATDHGAQIINLSLGGNNPSFVLADAVNYAYSRGVVVVAAAGNTGSNFVLYPARYPNVIAVGAVDNTNNRAGFSNYGPELDLVAPGASIYSTVIGGYDYKSGTSMAAPYVSGLAAILREFPGGYSPDGIVWLLQSTALDLGIPGKDDLYGFGLIQMDAAIQAVLPVSTQTFTATSNLLPILTISREVVPSAGPPVVFSASATLITSFPSPELVIISPTTISSESSPVGITETAEVNALETSSPDKAAQNWILPCLGTFLIILGIFLFWLARSNSRNYRRIRRFR